MLFKGPFINLFGLLTRKQFTIKAPRYTATYISKEIFVNKSVRIEPLDDKCLVLLPQTSIPNTNKTFVVFKCIADCLD